MDTLDEIYNIVDSMAENIRNGYDALNTLDATMPTDKNLQEVDDTVNSIQTKLEACRDILVQLGAGSPTDEGVDKFQEALETVQDYLAAVYRGFSNVGVETTNPVTLAKLDDAIGQVMVDAMQINMALEAKGIERPFNAGLDTVAEAINSISTGSNSNFEMGQYGRIIYTSISSDGELEFIPVKLESETDLVGLCNGTNSNTAELTVNGHTFQKQQLIEFSSAAMLNIIPEYFLYSCRNLSLGTIKIPSNVTSIGDYFMASCYLWNQPIDYSSATNLTSIGTRFCAWQYTLNKDVNLSATKITTLPARFMQSTVCFNSTLTLPNTLTSIGDYCLAWSHNLSNGRPIVIPDSVESIGNYFMYYNTIYNNAVTVGAGVKTIGNSFMYRCVTLNTRIIFNCVVTSIGKTFLGHSVNYNRSVQIEGDNATLGSSFMSGTSMNSADSSADENLNVTLSGTWTSIGTRFLAFQSWSSTNIVINGNNLVIGSYFYAGNANSASKTITITGSTSGTIGDYFLAHCPTFNGEVSIADGATAIGTYFMGNLPSYTKQVTIPTTITTIGDCFCYRHSSTSYYPAGLTNVTSVGTHFFAYSGGSIWRANAISLPACTSVGNFFGYCSGMTMLPSMPNITTIGNYFCAYSKVIDITNWNNYTMLGTLGTYCMSACFALVSPVGTVIIPDTLGTVPSGFMYGCYNFAGVIYVPKNSMFETSNSSFTAWYWTNTPLYQQGVIFTGQGGSMAQMSCDNLTGANNRYRKTSYVSS